jgi:uncharacterized protein (DUF2062 family)
VGRINATPHAVAAGFAAGVAVSFLPLNGMHILLAAMLAYLSRGSIIASVLGTLAGNPWTFPVIWWATYDVGVRLLPSHIDRSIPTEAFVRLLSDLASAVLTFDVTLVRTRIWSLWVPMMVGSLPLAAGSWVLTYVLLRWFVQSRRKIRSPTRWDDR